MPLCVSHASRRAALYALPLGCSHHGSSGGIGIWLSSSGSEAPELLPSSDSESSSLADQRSSLLEEVLALLEVDGMAAARCNPCSARRVWSTPRAYNCWTSRGLCAIERHTEQDGPHETGTKL